MVRKKRAVCFINQFFGQVGGEKAASVGFRVEEKPIGPAAIIDSLLGEDCEVIGTIICGDNYFAESAEIAVIEGIDLVKKLRPDLFFAGPAFNAGRYGISCGYMASSVAEQLGIPTVTGMHPENPAVDMFRRDTYIVKTGINSRKMREVIARMVDIGLRLLNGTYIGNADKEGYIMRDEILNEMQSQNSAGRAIEMLLKKIKGEAFVSELLPPTFEHILPAEPILDVSKAKIAFVTDGGLIPVGNPDKLKPNASTNFGMYNYRKLFTENHFVIHSGYDGTWVLENPSRLLPIDVAEELVKEGKLGTIDKKVYVVCGNCSSIDSAKRIGTQISKELLKSGVDAAILTST